MVRSLPYSDDRRTTMPPRELLFSWSAREYFARARSLKLHQSRVSSLSCLTRLRS